MSHRYTEFVDSGSIADDVLLYRRVDWDKVGGPNKTPHGREARLNSNCFTDYPAAKAMELGFPGPCMSVGLSTVLDELGLEPSAMLSGYPDYGLAVVRAGDLRALKKGNGEDGPQGIMRSPTDAEPWHCIVFDVIERPRKEACKKAIARTATWCIPLIGTGGLP